MGTVTTVASFASILASVLKISAGGPVYWIVTVIVGLLGVGWLMAQNKKAEKQAQDISNKQGEADQASNKYENQSLDEQGSGALDTVNKERAKAPDTDKLPPPG